MSKYRGVTSSVAALVSLIAASTPAMASNDWRDHPGPDGRTPRQVVTDCATGAVQCSFTPHELGEVAHGKFHKVSEVLYNCSTSPATRMMLWSDTTGYTNEVSVSASVGASLFSIVSISVEARYGHTWSNQHTETSATTIIVNPGEVGWISRASLVRPVTGYWTADYHQPKRSHWSILDIVTGPVAEGTEGKTSALAAVTRQMTTEEQSACRLEAGENGTYTSPP
ncbi:hypothetical protein [Streptomyces sp. NPDC019539]|uniref:hypothetical protein n=1 Tax=Streptomyces sp. NPDC019539 TaxID=3365063 RepID=UPI0037B7CD26